MLLDLGLLQATLQARVPRGRENDDVRSGASTSTTQVALAAVAVIFRTAGNGSELLVIERASHESDPWSGHLAFPGGRKDPEDEDVLATAKRETFEELGLDLDRHGELLGVLETVTTHGPALPSLAIVPFAFAVHGRPQLTPDLTEVANAFWVPVGPLLRGERDTTFVLERQSVRYSMPGYDVEGRVLWGLSYRMLRSFFALLNDS
jgi:8-oxo-dGTP pyrophosphatase MutT (NUDIX family)